MILTEINFKDNDFDDNNILKTSSRVYTLESKFLIKNNILN